MISIENISKFGIGCHKLYGSFEKKHSFQIISTALDNNINYFDTAPRYGDSEVLLGEFLKGNHEVLISSKVGLDSLNLSLLQKNKDYLKREFKSRMKKNFKFAERYLFNKLQRRYIERILNFEKNNYVPKLNLILNENQIRKSLASTLKNIKRNQLDIYFLHEPEQYYNLDEIESIFIKLKDEGLIRFYGLGFHRPENNANKYSDSFIKLNMFNKKLLSERRSSDNFSIIHGAMGFYKFGMDNSEKNELNNPLVFLDKLIENNPNTTFLMAPSNRNQIIQIHQ
jgi:aryl-alcohol dehydrogenase-like predicted oxidoreductase